MITIHFDFSNGSEISYIEGKKKGTDFSTNCLDFFSFDNETEVKIIKKNGEYILKSELLTDNHYTQKQIRQEHKIHKMLTANSFNWKQKIS